MARELQLVSALIAAAGLATAASAQPTGPDLTGSYPLEVTSQGSGCPALRRTSLEVRAVRGNQLDVVLDGQWRTGRLLGLIGDRREAREFLIPLRAFDSVRAASAQGFFDRQGGSIRAVIAIMFADGVDCTAELEGRRAAAAPTKPPQEPVAPPPEPGPTPIGPAPAADDCGAALTGTIRARWEEAGGAAGPLGCPSGPQQGLATPGGTRALAASFAGSGRPAMIVAPAGAASPLAARIVNGCFHSHYAAMGGPAGQLGLPTGNAEPDGDGAIQQFEGGTIRRDGAGQCRAELAERPAAWWRQIPRWARLLGIGALTLALGLLIAFLLPRRTAPRGAAS